MNYKVIDFENYYRKGVFEHFSKDCKCSLSITNSIDVTDCMNIQKKRRQSFTLIFCISFQKLLTAGWTISCQ